MILEYNDIDVDDIYINTINIDSLNRYLYRCDNNEFFNTLYSILYYNKYPPYGLFTNLHDDHLSRIFYDILPITEISRSIIDIVIIPAFLSCIKRHRAYLISPRFSFGNYAFLSPQEINSIFTDIIYEITIDIRLDLSVNSDVYDNIDIQNIYDPEYSFNEYLFLESVDGLKVYLEPIMFDIIGRDISIDYFKYLLFIDIKYLLIEIFDDLNVPHIIPIHSPNSMNLTTIHLLDLEDDKYCKLMEELTAC